ncbi:MAG: sugar ABC transporter permease [Chloroflexi bacterium]|nr:sugar ABC transporter permease [Chloroflexota bacterium]
MEVPKQNEPQESIDANESSHLDRSEYPVPDNTEKQPKRGLGFQRVVDLVTAYSFITPALIIIFLFGLFPIGYAFYMSLINWNVRKGAFIGFRNYLEIFGSWENLYWVLGGVVILIIAFIVQGRIEKAKNEFSKYSWLVFLGIAAIAGVLFSKGWSAMMETGDKSFLQSLVNTLYYALGTVPTQIIIGIVIAYLLYQNIKFKEGFRLLYFLPYITPAVTTSVIFRIIFNREAYSIANRFIKLFGMDPLKWRFESKPIMQLLGFNIEGFWAGPSLALIVIMIFGIWSFVGYNVVIFLSGLGNIPKEVYEAAEIDGATKWQLFKNITIPYLSPITFYLTLISLIGTFKAFNHIYVLKLPSAGDSVVTASVYIFERFYKFSQFGRATAMSMVLFLIILGLTFIQNKLMAERVFYG